MESATYHDSCYLGRHCEIYEEPRKILELIGYDLKEMQDSKENGMCCGSCGGLAISNPELADEVAKQRLLQAKRIGVGKIIVASMENYQLFKKNSLETGIEILELSEVLATALDIKKEIEVEEEQISNEEKIILDTKANIKLQEEIEEEDYYDNEEDI